MTTSTQGTDEVVRQGIRAWETAIDAGVKMHEEGSKWLRQMFSEAGSLNDWYDKSQTAASDIMAKAQENVDETIRLVNQNAEASVKLIQKLLDARQSDSNSDAQARLVEWWEAALDAMLMNTQAGLQANGRILTAWSELAKRVNGDVADKLADLAKRTAEQADKMARSAAERVKEMAAHVPGNNGG
jgi:hypothetical protein